MTTSHIEMADGLTMATNKLTMPMPLQMKAHDVQRNGNWPVFHKPLISTDYR
jgi:hypothetical protein